MRTGTLRHRVELQREVTSVTSFGDQEKDWETFATVWASIAPLSAREFTASSQKKSEVMARITIRHRTDVDSSVRIKHGTTKYNIEGVLADPDSGREYLTLPCSANLNDG